jgi:poly-gamma-glutamate capsule biosynthesis protein CapA/YwtB (metallophosphatase superfamily)
MSSKTINLLAVGDIQMMTREPAPDLFEHVAGALSAADIAFANCEWPYAEEAGDTHPVEAHINDDFDGGDLFLPGSPDCIKMIGAAGFDVMSLANNHSMHGGYRAFLRTIGLLGENGVASTGGGANIEEARKPAVLERGGQKVAFLACTSGFLPGAYAGRRTPGIVRLRRHTYAENPVWENWGIEPTPRTVTNPEDLAALCASIEAAKATADAVVVSCHWGILEDVSAIDDYQRVAARAFIDAGADLIVSQGPLAIKGFETYRGKAVLYGMGKFMMVSPWMKRGDVPSGITAPIMDETRRGLGVSVTIQDGAIASLSIVPVGIDGGKPRFLASDDPNFAQILSVVAERSEAAKLNGRTDAQGKILFS